jgi:hypothetical protein
VDCFTFLGTIISSDLAWENNTDAVVKKAQQRLFFLRQLKQFGLGEKLLFISIVLLLRVFLHSQYVYGSAASARGAGLTEW